ncbi:type II secretion system F family protein [Microbacterium sp. ARD31]|uniref:type II secretion system F family protein n=1 Tax=Microbacterium sp. ARD31 TaxID=2962576 RepID=UPI0028829D62|nr:type II secretion system F family protein [Microbacterium sp. ARD31]MDT0182913.1 type II secretion system F family protein [Microbacterium sp. ARD31]
MTWLAAVCASLAVLLWLPPGQRTPRRPTSSGPPLRAIGVVGAGVAAWLFVGGAAGPVAGVVGAAGAWWTLSRVEPPGARREREEVQRTLPHLIDLLASTLRSGADPVAGLAQVCDALPGAAAERLAPVVEHARWGATAAEAWRAVGDDEQLAPLVRAMVRSYASGASVVDLVERLADELEREGLAQAEDAARRVGVAAAVPLGVCLLPAFLLLGVVPTVASLFGTVAP